MEPRSAAAPGLCILSSWGRCVCARTQGGLSLGTGQAYSQQLLSKLVPKDRCQCRGALQVRAFLSQASGSWVSSRKAGGLEQEQSCRGREEAQGRGDPASRPVAEPCLWKGAQCLWGCDLLTVLLRPTGTLAFSLPGTQANLPHLSSCAGLPGSRVRGILMKFSGPVLKGFLWGILPQTAPCGRFLSLLQGSPGAQPLAHCCAAPGLVTVGIHGCLQSLSRTGWLGLLF